MNTLMRGIPAAVVALLAFPAIASAADPCNAGASSVAAAGCVTEVEAVSLEPAAPAAPTIEATPAIAVAGKQQLPVTGGDAAKLAVVGGGLIAAGAVLTVRSRRTNAAV